MCLNSLILPNYFGFAVLSLLKVERWTSIIFGPFGPPYFRIPHKQKSCLFWGWGELEWINGICIHFKRGRWFEMQIFVTFKKKTFTLSPFMKPDDHKHIKMFLTRLSVSVISSVNGVLFVKLFTFQFPLPVAMVAKQRRGHSTLFELTKKIKSCAVFENNKYDVWNFKSVDSAIHYSAHLMTCAINVICHVERRVQAGDSGHRIS